MADDITSDLKRSTRWEQGMRKTYTLMDAGIVKKAALGGGGISGVVDLAVCWRNGEGITTCGPMVPGITGPVYVLPGEIGITGGAAVCCMVCPEL